MFQSRDLCDACAVYTAEQLVHASRRGSHQAVYGHGSQPDHRTRLHRHSPDSAHRPQGLLVVVVPRLWRFFDLLSIHKLLEVTY